MEVVCTYGIYTFISGLSLSLSLAHELHMGNTWPATEYYYYYYYDEYHNKIYIDPGTTFSP